MVSLYRDTSFYRGASPNRHLTTQRNPTIDSMEECRKCQSSSSHLVVQSSRPREDSGNSEQLLHQLTIWHGSRGVPHSGPTYRQLYQYMAFARLPVLSWLVSNNCSLFLLCAHVYVLLFALMSPTASAAPISSEKDEVRDPQLALTCSDGFFHKLQECIQPFLSGVGDGHLKKPATLSTHLCLEYQLALLCVHSALTQCPGLDNIRQVQATLGSPQAVQVNHLCSISTQNPKLSAGGETTAQRFHRHRQHLAANKSSVQPPVGLGQEFVSTTTLHADVLYTTTSHRTTLPPTSNMLGSNTLGLSQLSDPGSHDMRLNIEDFVNNYQFDKSPAQDMDHSGTSLLQIVVGTSTGSVARLNISILFVVCVGLTLTAH